MGAYAVEYITASSKAQRGYYEVAIRISYRRTLEQLQAVVNATSPEALYSLVADALDQGETELAVRMGYWGEDGRTRVEDAMLSLREERELTETAPWVVNYYPTEENPGLVEFLLDPPQPEEGGESESPEGGEDAESGAENAEGNAAGPEGEGTEEPAGELEDGVEAPSGGGPEESGGEREEN